MLLLAGSQDLISGYGDSDWAGDRKTRKSTSGGGVMVGSHLLHHYSNSQANIALSSAEAELNASVKLSAECLGVRNMLHDLGHEVGIMICTDSSADKGILTRRGCGKIKHLCAKQLWVQEYVIRGEIVVVKIPRKENPSDVLTHNWTGNDGDHFVKMGVYKQV